MPMGKQQQIVDFSKIIKYCFGLSIMFISNFTYQVRTAEIWLNHFSVKTIILALLKQTVRDRPLFSKIARKAFRSTKRRKKDTG